MNNNERCPDCDRETCRKADVHREYIESKPENADESLRPLQRAADECWTHRVDWRARALKAEAAVARVREVIEGIDKWAKELQSESDYPCYAAIARVLQKSSRKLRAALDGPDNE